MPKIDDILSFLSCFAFTLIQVSISMIISVLVVGMLLIIFGSPLGWYIDLLLMSSIAFLCMDYRRSVVLDDTRWKLSKWVEIIFAIAAIFGGAGYSEAASHDMAYWIMLTCVAVFWCSLPIASTILLRWAARK